MSMNNAPALLGLTCVAVGACYLIDTGQSLGISTLPQIAAASIIGGLGLLAGLLFSQAALHRAEQALTGYEHQRRQSHIARRHSEDALHADLSKLRAELAAVKKLREEHLLDALTRMEDGQPNSND